MRITNNFVQRTALAQLQANLSRISDAQQRVATGLKLTRASDDPVGAASAMQARSGLRALEQYRRNLDGARSRAAVEEDALGQLGDLLTRARELALSQGGDTANAQTREATAAEVDQLLQQAIAIGNTKLGDEFVFGGYRAHTQPFDAAQPDFLPRDADGDAVAITGNPQVEIGAGRRLTPNHNGDEVFLQSGALDSLKRLSTALHANDAAGVRATLDGLDSGFARVQSLLGEQGARIGQIEVSASSLDTMRINLDSVRAGIEEVDFEQAVTELMSRQTAYQAAMLATSRVMGLTLADYLR
jgi:flagellar hook-associated protein 3 FlgL